MDEKEIKSRLKCARDKIQSKNFNDALKLCEEILRLQPENYTALVFAGRCHVELNNPTAGRECYTRATSLDQTQLLAWQGLHQLYEKYSIWDGNSISCLKQLIALSSDETKKREYKFQLATTLAKAGLFDESAAEFLLLTSAVGDEWQRQIDEAVVQYFGNTVINGEPLAFIKCCFSRCVENASDNDEKQKLQIKLVHFLVQNRAYNDAYELFIQLGVSTSYGPGFWCDLTTVICDRYVEGTFNEADEELLNKLDECFETDDQEVAAKDDTRRLISSMRSSALLDVANRNWTDVIESLEEKQLQLVKCPYLWFLLSETRLRLHDYIGAVAASAEAQRFWQDQHHNLHRLRAIVIEANALMEIGSTTSLKKASDLYNDILSNCSQSDSIGETLTAEAKMGLALVSAARGSRDQALDYLNSVPNRTAQYWLTNAKVQLILGDHAECETAVNEAETIVDEEEDDRKAALHYLRGRMLWDKDINQAFKEFMEAAKLDADHADTFFYIGRYYDRLNANAYSEKAVKCYERAYALAGGYNFSIGCALSDAYRKINAHEKNLALLLEITQSQPVENVTWAWLRLGLEYLSEGKADDAVGVLQTVLRLMDSDVRCWECLGEAYAMRGSYASALRAFEKAVQLETDKSKLTYANYRAASINLTMYRYEDAAKQFRVILQSDANHLPSLVGLSHSLVQLAKSYSAEGRFQRSLDVYVEAITTLIAIIQLDGHCVSAWCLLGSASTRLGNFPSCHLEKANLDRLDAPSFNADFKSKLGLLKFGSRCFAQAISLNCKLPHAWHDLGMNLFFQASWKEQHGETVELISQSISCLQHAIRLDPSNPRFWYSLGALAVSTFVAQSDLAQHCFVKSLSLEPHQPVAWSGLGILYKKFGEMTLAYQCFARAQAIDPDYANCWIGQATIAADVQPKETIGLFRHAVELGNNIQGCLGYGYHVLQTIVDPSADSSSSEHKYAIEHLHAIPTALVALQKYCWMNPSDPCAWNMLALLLEHEGLLASAGSTYLQSLELVKKSSSEDAELEELVGGNACRLFGKIGNSAMMRKLAGRMTTKNSFENLCMRALAYYRCGQSDKATDLYSQALYASNTKVDQIAVTCALTLIAAKEGDWSKNKDLLKEKSSASYAPLLFWSSICSLLEKAKVDTASLRSGFLQLAQLSDGADWQALLAAVCSLYYQAFALPDIQWLVHLLPYDCNIRIMFHRIWQKRAVETVHVPAGRIDAMTKWQALRQMKECRRKELLYAKIKHQYPDMFDSKRALV